MRRRDAKALFQATSPAIRAFRLLLAADQQFKIVVAAVAGVFVDRHGNHWQKREGGWEQLDSDLPVDCRQVGGYSPVSLPLAATLRYRSPRAGEAAHGLLRRDFTWPA